MKNLVIVVFPAKEEKFEELKNTLEIALVDTRAFEGCISIDTYEDNSTNTIYLIEDWESLDNHLKLHIFLDFSSDMIKFHEISSIVHNSTVLVRHE